MSATVLVVDDDRNLRETLAELLSGARFRVLQAENGRAAYTLLQTNDVDLLLCDWKMPESGGEDLLNAMASEGRTRCLPIIIMTAHGSSDNAITAMRLGAYDFITKPFDLDSLMTLVRRALDHSRLQKEVEELRSRIAETTPALQGTLIGPSRAMLEVSKAIGRVSNTDATALVLGESGTGKELVARAIHEYSARARLPFIVVNCAALPAELLESELFGHEKGAFTGAIQCKIGKFEAARGGTIFLDEIGELPLALQPKLLRILQDHSFERVGGTETLEADFRLIAATNRKLEIEVAEGRFREDLFYRLHAFPIQIAPLRERRSDILPLAEHFLATFRQRNGLAPCALSDDAIAILQSYPYPGNVRELEHILERAALFARGRLIDREIMQQSLPALPQKFEGSFEALLELPFHASVQAWERLLIERALQASNGNKTDAARRLGIQRRLLYDKLRDAAESAAPRLQDRERDEHS